MTCWNLFVDIVIIFICLSLWRILFRDELSQGIVDRYYRRVIFFWKWRSCYYQIMMQEVRWFIGCLMLGWGGLYFGWLYFPRYVWCQLIFPIGRPENALELSSNWETYLLILQFIWFRSCLLFRRSKSALSIKSSMKILIGSCTPCLRPVRYLTLGTPPVLVVLGIFDLDLNFFL